MTLGIIVVLCLVGLCALELLSFFALFGYCAFFVKPEDFK